MDGIKVMPAEIKTQLHFITYNIYDINNNT